jgi:PPOX class probable F420-dependent enzyme
MSALAGHTDFLSRHHSAAMVTLATDGTPKVARVGCALVDGKLWSSGTRDRVRTARLRRDPRCTLFVYDGTGYGWLAVESTVTILDGPDAAELNLRLFRAMQGKPSGPLSWFGGELSEAEFLATMRSEGRLVYEFEAHRVYGTG